MTSEPPSAQEMRSFAATFRAFLEWIHAEATTGNVNEVMSLVSGFLGETGLAHSVVTRELPPFEHVNLQTALNHWQAAEGRHVAVHGVGMPPHFGQVSLQQLMTGDGLPPLHLCAPELLDVSNGPGTTIACLRSALLLVQDQRGSYVLFLLAPGEHQQSLRLELVGLEVAQAQDVLAELDKLRSELNVYRGHVLDVATNQMGGLVLTFVEPVLTARDDIVLPQVVLERIERHALGVAEHREELLAVGQHLKRGLLLFGPPGTGKTHTTRYLVGRMDGYTRLLLSGRSLHAVGSVAELARDLEPAVVILEDVDLVAHDRSFGPGASTVLFDLLDAMDGAASDADLLFVLTTNRADLLEPALAARPGRVDVAVEIGLPDADARRKLFDLYSRNAPIRLSAAEIENVVERTLGVTASFVKELVRRAVLIAMDEPARPITVGEVQMTAALDDLLDSTQSVTRTLLGVGGATIDPQGPPDAAYASYVGQAGGGGWVTRGAPGAPMPGRTFAVPRSRFFRR